MFFEDAQEEVKLAVDLARQGNYDYIMDLVKANKGT